MGSRIVELTPWTDPNAPAPAAAPWVDVEEMIRPRFHQELSINDGGWSEVGLWGRRSDSHHAMFIFRFRRQLADIDLNQIVRVAGFAQVIAIHMSEADGPSPPAVVTWLEVDR